MLRSLGMRAAVAAAVVISSVNAVLAADPGVTFIGEGAIPGNAVDQSNLKGTLEDAAATPRNQAGGFGSAIAYSGREDLYYGTPDRGPADGTTTYIDRIYGIRIGVTPAGGGKYTITPRIVSTKLMRASGNTYFTGSAKAFDETGSPQSLRFDPEGVRVSACGRSAYVSDEYGPYIYEFDLGSGKRLRSVALPNKFVIDLPSDDPTQELTQNAFGRQANRGMEGLAISPDGRKLYGIMQSPLIQDGGLGGANGTTRVGLNVRILEITLGSGEAREFLYRLESASNGISEIVAVNDHEFLVLERDGRAGTSAVFKKIFKIDIAGATDIRTLKSMESVNAPANVTAVAKSVFINMLDADYGLAGATFPEKLEGLAFGPDLPDGRRLLIVTQDNDFIATQPSRFFAFAIDRAMLPGYAAQRVGEDGRHCRDDRDDDD